MKRREFIAGTAALLVSSRRSWAQETPRRIGFLGGRFDAALWPSFLDGLREHGWKEGHNIVVEGRWTEGRPERYVELASELVSLKMDVIVASAPPAVQALQQATGTIPIVMIAVADPVKTGFAKSLAEPGGNITGITSLAGPSIIFKLLELTKDALPSAKIVGILFNEGNPLNYVTAAASQILAAAKSLELELLWLPIRTADDLEPSLSMAQQGGANAIIGSGDPLLFAEREFINDTAERNGVPTIWSAREYLSGRGLFSYGPTFRGMLRQAAVYVDRILRGGKPATMPVEQPTRYDLVLNLKTAKASRPNHSGRLPLPRRRGDRVSPPCSTARQSFCDNTFDFEALRSRQGQAEAILVAYDIVELDGEHVPGAAAGAQEAGEGLMVTFREQRRLDTCPEILKR